MSPIGGIVPLICMLLAPVFLCVAGQDDACTPENLGTNLQACLDAIRQVAENSSYFWFGDSYPTRCPPERALTIPCYYPTRNPHTLSTLAFGINNTDIAVVNRFIDVKYTSVPGSYTGCDYTFNQTDTEQITIDPLSNMTYTPWQLRAMPEVMWSAAPTDRFALIFLDVAFNNLHGLYVNIPGNNVSQGDEVLKYYGPGNYRDAPNVYAFLLYKQSATIDPTSISIQRTPPANLISFNATQFSRSNLADLVGLTWLLASYDAYSVQLLATGKVLQNCADLVEKALTSSDHPKRPWIPEDLDLSVFLRVRLQSDAITYPCGNETGSQPAVDFYVDPIGSPIINTAAARTGSTVTYTMEMNRLGPNNAVDFISKMYSLVFVDPDIPASRPSVGTNDRPLLHGLTVNINGSDVTTGSVLQTYLGTGPPDRRHYYYFLLYEQKGVLQVNKSSEYTNCTGRLVDRCRFDVAGFASSNNLTLVGVSWFTAMPDEYRRCRFLPIPPSPPSGGPAAAPAQTVLASLIAILVSFKLL